FKSSISSRSEWNVRRLTMVLIPIVCRFSIPTAVGKKQPTIWKPADIGLDPSEIGEAGRKSKLLKLFQPVREGKCEFVEADSPADAGAKLAEKLREAKLL
ncbi:MAG: hypothetical protein P8105_13660, partial [Dehalococcoidia bacterium]